MKTRNARVKFMQTRSGKYVNGETGVVVVLIMIVVGGWVIRRRWVVDANCDDDSCWRGCWCGNAAGCWVGGWWP